jgi:hypothetical protein
MAKDAKDPGTAELAGVSTGGEAAASPKKGAVQYEAVTMTDKRIVDFAGKTRILKHSEAKDGKLTVRLDFRNGETRTFTLPKELVERFALHGAEQKLGDEAAGLTDVGDAVIAIDQLIERLNKGEWAIKREPGQSVAGTSVLVRALMEHTGKTQEDVKKFLENKSHAEKMALRNNPKVKVIIDRLEADKTKKATKGVDTDALLSELGS